MRLRDQGIVNYGGGIDRVRQARRLSDDNGGVIRGRVICNASEGSEKTMEAAGARKQAQ